MSATSVRVVRMVWLVFFLGLIVGSVVWVGLLAQKVARQKARPLPVYGRVPPLEFVDQNGNTVSLRSLEGQVWIADFIFTRCAGPCPLMSSQMEELQKSLRASQGVRLVSFTVDPQYDRPEILLGYARRYHADPNRWIFLRGDPQATQKMMKEDFKLGMENAQDGADNAIVHGTHLVLVDAGGRIRGYYGSVDASPVAQIYNDVQALLGEQ